MGRGRAQAVESQRRVRSLIQSFPRDSGKSLNLLRTQICHLYTGEQHLLCKTVEDKRITSER